jgi:hypothetical protein
MSRQNAVRLIHALMSRSLRDATRCDGELAVSLGIEHGEFEALFPEEATASDHDPISIAKPAATLLRQLDDYLDGLIQATAINEQVTLEQLKVAREAARRPPGFTPNAGQLALQLV